MNLWHSALEQTRSQTSLVGIPWEEILIATVMFLDFHLPLYTVADPPAPSDSPNVKSLYSIVAITQAAIFYIVSLAYPGSSGAQLPD